LRSEAKDWDNQCFVRKQPVLQAEAPIWAKDGFDDGKSASTFRLGQVDVRSVAMEDVISESQDLDFPCHQDEFTLIVGLGE
jgi:hypothetical protein